jgi:hypothetical protein
LRLKPFVAANKTRPRSAPQDRCQAAWDCAGTTTDGVGDPKVIQEQNCVRTAGKRPAVGLYL